ncbi:MAG: hypothetical protein FWB91_02835 [Defluviitaleaceae bacterium]|nr:hypothetical protein [Defluviitaleaceae bacterium]
MQFPETTLRLVNFRTTEKEGKKYTFVKLADEKTFDSNEFMLNREQSPENLVVQTRYKVILNIEGRYASVILQPEKGTGAAGAA